MAAKSKTSPCAEIVQNRIKLCELVFDGLNSGYDFGRKFHGA
jgi:hypothetical protein